MFLELFIATIRFNSMIVGVQMKRTQKNNLQFQNIERATSGTDNAQSFMKTTEIRKTKHSNNTG